MVIGIEKFKSAFKNYTDKYVLIGGAACDNLMIEAGLEFRTTKDLDIVLIIELIENDFVSVFWDFIKEGNYEHKQKSNGEMQFYRFMKPKDTSFPAMIELFSRKLESINLPEESTLTPIPTEEEMSSLSAILLDDDYYDFILSHIIDSAGIPVVTADCLIILKAKAWMDLSKRKENGEKIDSKNIKKHKNDIIRISQLLIPGKTISLSESIQQDMVEFMEKYEKDTSIIPKNLGVKVEADTVFRRLKEYFELS
ncbi:MAG: hypothetical protein P9L97_09715 [Candidatus Tenebribacter davisii]|nr:hypothetical protein [Candidatus Tenebribacter davisii]